MNLEPSCPSLRVAVVTSICCQTGSTLPAFCSLLRVKVFTSSFKPRLYPYLTNCVAFYLLQKFSSLIYVAHIHCFPHEYFSPLLAVDLPHPKFKMIKRSIRVIPSMTSLELSWHRKIINLILFNCCVLFHNRNML